MPPSKITDKPHTCDHPWPNNRVPSAIFPNDDLLNNLNLKLLGATQGLKTCRFEAVTP